MMMTATILATGPSIDSRIDWSGASQGIDEPPAHAGAAVTSVTKAVLAASMARRAPYRMAWVVMGYLRCWG